MSRKLNRVYEYERPFLKTGDMLLFSGKGLISALIKNVTQCKWSHIGMVYKIASEDLVLCLESTSLNGSKGVQVVELSRLVDTYKGEISYRSLSRELTKTEKNRLRKFRKEMMGVPYETSLLDLMLSAIGAWRNTGTKNDSLFCSEMFAATLQWIGILSEQYHSSSYSPKRFACDMDVPYIDVHYKMIRSLK